MSLQGYHVPPAGPCVCSRVMSFQVGHVPAASEDGGRVGGFLSSLASAGSLQEDPEQTSCVAPRCSARPLAALWHQPWPSFFPAHQYAGTLILGPIGLALFRPLGVVFRITFSHPVSAFPVAFKRAPVDLRSGSALSLLVWGPASVTHSKNQSCPISQNCSDGIRNKS